MAIKKVKAIKEFFGTEERPVKMDELKNLISNDKPAYEWLAKESAKALGQELED